MRTSDGLQIAIWITFQSRIHYEVATVILLLKDVIYHFYIDVILNFFINKQRGRNNLLCVQLSTVNSQIYLYKYQPGIYKHQPAVKEGYYVPSAISD